MFGRGSTVAPAGTWWSCVTFAIEKSAVTQPACPASAVTPTRCTLVTLIAELLGFAAVKLTGSAGRRGYAVGDHSRERHGVAGSYVTRACARSLNRSSTRTPRLRRRRTTTATRAATFWRSVNRLLRRSSFVVVIRSCSSRRAAHRLLGATGLGGGGNAPSLGASATRSTPPTVVGPIPAAELRGRRGGGGHQVEHEVSVSHEAIDQSPLDGHGRPRAVRRRVDAAVPTSSASATGVIGGAAGERGTQGRCAEARSRWYQRLRPNLERPVQLHSVVGGGAGRGCWWPAAGGGVWAPAG